MSEPSHEPLHHPPDEPTVRPATDPGATTDENLLAALADEFAARARRGERPTLDEYIAKHPALAEQVRNIFPAIAVIEETRSTDSAAVAEGPGSTIGRYKLLERIGEGGFGVVYMAEQHLPVRRRVALKVLKPGMDSRQVLARFEAERQALAIMDHPNIAKVFDGGMTDSGRPYFVMELVKGAPITEFCDRQHLTPRQRLDLFTHVCHAVQHAHQKGIIHRDIKPTNVMVIMHDATPVVKVIDFGVAKALGQELTERTLFTGFAQLLGTPLYMSPEQAGQSALDVDTRSDIYSLGVLLYELLTSTTPFDKERFKKAAHDEIRRIICEEEPPTPSTRLSQSKDSLASISAMRQTEPAKLTKLVRGELDWIVMKALEKDRNRRYETANGLAMDVQRYLADEPVLACPPSSFYRLEKFVRRNRRALITGALLGAMLLVIAGSFGWVARDRTARRARTTEAVVVLLDQCEEALRASQSDRAAVALGAAERRAADGGAEPFAERLNNCRADLNLLQALEEIDRYYSTYVENKFPDRKDVAARWRAALTSYGLTDKDSAADAARRINASLVRDRVLMTLDLCLAFDPSTGVPTMLRSADPDSYRDAVRDAVASGDEPKLVALAAHPDALAQPARFAALVGQLPGLSTDRQRRVLENALRTRPEDFTLLLAMDRSYGERSEDATERLRWSQAAVSAHPRNPVARNNLGHNLLNKGDLDGAIAEYREAIRLDPKFANPHSNLGTALRKKGDVDAAIVEFKESLRLAPDNARPWLGIGRALLTKGDMDGAMAAFREAMRAPENAAAANNELGQLLGGKGDVKGALACFREAVRLEPTSPAAQTNLGIALQISGDLNGGIAEHREAIRLDPRYAIAHNNLGIALHQGKRDLDGALVSYREAVRLDPSNPQFRNNLGGLLLDRRDLDPAAAELREAARLDPRSALAQFNLGLVLHAKGDLRGALTAYRAVVELDPNNAECHNALAWLLATGPDGLRDGKQAVEHGVRACELTEWKAPNNFDTLAAAYAEAGDFDKAVDFQRKALSYPSFLIQQGLSAKQRLDLYQQKTPFREPAVAFDASTRPVQ